METVSAATADRLATGKPEDQVGQPVRSKSKSVGVYGPEWAHEWACAAEVGSISRKAWRAWGVSSYVLNSPEYYE
jgi:hypothetical protein